MPTSIARTCRFLKASRQVDSNGIALTGRSVDEVCPDP
jgi:hypothetical protein